MTTGMERAGPGTKTELGRRRPERRASKRYFPGTDFKAITATAHQLAISTKPPSGVTMAKVVISVSTKAYSEKENSNTPTVKPITGNRQRGAPSDD